MSPEELAALQAEHDKDLADQRALDREQLTLNEAANYERTHGEPAEVEVVAWTETLDDEEI